METNVLVTRALNQSFGRTQRSAANAKRSVATTCPPVLWLSFPCCRSVPPPLTQDAACEAAAAHLQTTLGNLTFTLEQLR